MSGAESDSEGGLSDLENGRRSSVSSSPDVNFNDFSDDEVLEEDLDTQDDYKAHVDKKDKDDSNLVIAREKVLDLKGSVKSCKEGKDQSEVLECIGMQSGQYEDNQGNAIDSRFLDPSRGGKKESVKLVLFNISHPSSGSQVSANTSDDGLSVILVLNPSDGLDDDPATKGIEEEPFNDSDIEDTSHLDIELDTSSDDEDSEPFDFEFPQIFKWDIPKNLLEEEKNPVQIVRSPYQEKIALDKVINALKTKKSRYPRIFHTKTNPGREVSDDSGLGMYGKKAIVAYSPLNMLAQIAKAYNKDITELMESSESMNETLRFPCMQCYEKKSTSRQGYGKMRGYQAGNYEGFGGYGGSSAGVVNGRCSSCGGAVLTISTYCLMIKKMREKLSTEKLLIRDTYPDGNCLFGSIIDQLYIRGNFRYTIAKLREAAVTYLREHPVSEDGTPYEMFLTEETWDTYLTRMSLDGEWGDHMVLSAIASFLNTRIVIYGGMDGAGETIIYPRGYNQDDGPPLETIYIGHLGECHYVSLRPQQWREKLDEKINSSGYTDEPDPYLDKLSQRLLPLHSDSLLKTIFTLEYVTSLRQDVIEVITPGRQEDGKFVYEMMGNLINQIEPCVCEVESLFTPIEVYFPGLTDTYTDTKSTAPMLILFCIPKDSRVIFNPTKASTLDLISMYTDNAVVGQMKLTPVDPKVWRATSEQHDDGSHFLKTFTVDVDAKKLFPILYEFSGFKLYPVIAFSCRWPDEAFEWIPRQRQAGWLTEDLIEKIVVGGCHVIPLLRSHSKELTSVTDDFSLLNNGNDNTWALSFAAAEKVLFQQITPSQRNCFLFLKMYVSKLFSSEDTTFEASIRSIFLYACEDIDSKVWERHPGVCIISLLQSFAHGLEDGLIPHFFVTEKNLIGSIPKQVVEYALVKVQTFCKQTFIGLYFFLDQFNITTTEIAPLLDDILEHLCTDNIICNDFYLEIILPSFASMFESLVTSQDLRNAQIIAESMRTDISQFVGIDAPMKVILNNSLPMLFIGYKWCFALYLDISSRTNLTQEILKGHSTVSIKNIFGPDCTDYLPDTVVGVEFSIAYGDLNFPLHVEQVLNDLGNTQAITICMRYYLDTLNDIAGEELVVKDTMKTQNLALLYSLYIHLFSAYVKLNIVEEFRSMMPVMTKIVDAIGTAAVQRRLQSIWRALGDYSYPDQASRGARSTVSKTTNPESMLMGMVGLMMLDEMGMDPYMDVD